MKTIVWDVDDVLNDLMRLWLEDYQQKHSLKKKLFLKDITENPPLRMIKTSLNEYHRSIDAFRLSGIYGSMEPLRDVVNWFKDHGNRARHIALSSVPLKAAHLSAKWVFENFGQWIRTYHFVPSKRYNEKIPCYDGGKTDYLKWMNRSDIIVVDDNEPSIKGALDLGLKGIIFPRPWNKAEKSIKETLETIKEMISE